MDTEETKTWIQKIQIGNREQNMDTDNIIQIHGTQSGNRDYNLDI
jgi:hypothetical protein